MGYAESFRSGAEVQSQGNPFSGIIKRVDEARARKAADDKDLRELQGLFTQLGMKHEYEKSLQEDKSKQEEFYKSYEPAQEGEPYVPFKGTPFEEIAGQVNWKKKPLITTTVFGNVNISGNPLTEEGAKQNIPQGEDPEDYIIKPILRNIK